jgi:MYXO-CTERM domain-containing protein
MKISTQAKLISTALVAVVIAAPIAHGETDGTLLSRASQNAALTKTNPGTVSDGTLLSKAAGLPGHQSSSGSYPRLKSGEGFSFKVPSYWNADPGYWSTAQRTGAQTAPVSQCPCNVGLIGGRSLSPVATSSSLDAGTYVGVNRSLGVPLQYLGSTEQVSTASSGFDWMDAGVGAAFVAGLGAIGLVALVALRRRNSVAQLEV